MIRLLLPTAIIQLLYLALCLPPSHSGTSSTRPKATSSLGRLIPAVLSLLLTLTLAPPVLSAFCVLLGAPLTTHWEHTALLATHLSLLTVLPLVYTNGVDGERWRAVIGLLGGVDEGIGGLVGGVMGGWMGAVPIPLDW